jgi:antitoxin HigA-1
VEIQNGHLHPGRILVELMKLKRIGTNELANKIGICPRRLVDIRLCRKPIDANIAHNLSAIFDISALEWITLQSDYDLRVARAKLKLLEDQHNGKHKKDVVLQNHKLQK